MPQIEGLVSAEIAGVGAQTGIPAHYSRYPVNMIMGGAYRIGAVTGTLAASLAQNSELFQFRYAPTIYSKLAIVTKITVSAGSNLAAAAAAATTVRITVARQWTGIGTGGTRIVPSGDSCKLRTSFPPSEVNDIGIATTGALGLGTKTLDIPNSGNIAYGIGTGALTVSTAREKFERTKLFDSDGEGQFPMIFAPQEGFIIRTGAVLPSGMTWNFAVDVAWFEVLTGY